MYYKLAKYLSQNVLFYVDSTNRKSQPKLNCLTATQKVKHAVKIKANRKIKSHEQIVSLIWLAVLSLPFLLKGQHVHARAALTSAGQ